MNLTRPRSEERVVRGPENLGLGEELMKQKEEGGKEVGSGWVGGADCRIPGRHDQTS